MADELEEEVPGLPMGQPWFVDYTGSVEVVINDPSVITRCVENHDDEGVPQEYANGGTGWRNTHYDLADAEDVLCHLAYNCAANGITEVNRLDGWADLPDGAATMRDERWVEYQRVVEPEKETAT